MATDMESTMIYIRDNLLDEINETDGIQRSIELEDGILHPIIKIFWDDDGFEDGEEFENMEEIAEWLRDQGYDYRIANYRYESRIYPNTMFLTQKAAEEHLEANDYHYSADRDGSNADGRRKEKSRVLLRYWGNLKIDK